MSNIATEFKNISINEHYHNPEVKKAFYKWAVFNFEDVPQLFGSYINVVISRYKNGV